MRIKVWITCLAGVMTFPAIAAAHNLGHIFLPDGTCKEIASAQEAPLVGPDRTQLDLVPETANPPRDEYGVSFVGHWGRTPIRPGRCPVTVAAATAVTATTATNTHAPAPTAANAAPASKGPSGPWFGAGRGRTP